MGIEKPQYANSNRKINDSAITTWYAFVLLL
jgi:hypothetical protein